MDIFGKELGLTDAERQLLSDGCDVFLRKVLQVDTHSEKGDTTEPKILLISNSRCFILSHQTPAKLEASFNFMNIQQLECTESKLTFHLAGDPRPQEFYASRRDSVEITSLITAQLENVFPISRLEMISKVTFDPKSIQVEVQQLRKNLLSVMEHVDATTIPGFITAYGFLCDFYGVPFNKEVSWYLRNVYLAHGFRDLQLSDFDYLSDKDLLPVISTLRHNDYFEGIVGKDAKMSQELFDELSYVVKVSRVLKKLVLRNCSMRPEDFISLTAALKSNPKSALTHLDISNNILDEQAVESLGAVLETLPHGLRELSLANCNISPREGSYLANCMKQNRAMQYSLVHFDISGNPLGPDPQEAFTFLQEPNTIARLNLSKCGIELEFVIPMLIRGCQSYLRELNLSHNMVQTKKEAIPTNVGSQFLQFCGSAVSIAMIDLTDCKISCDFVIAMLQGLTVNPNIQPVDLKLASNDLGQSSDPLKLASLLSRTMCLHRLDVSDCGLDNLLPQFVQSIAANPSIRHLAIGRNFNGKPIIREQAVQHLDSFLSREGCQLESLCLKDSGLRDQAAVILGAVETNRSLTTLNISGNQMQNSGARCLAKVLLSNCMLREVIWDRNDTTFHGFQCVANALEHNFRIHTMPLPLCDISRAGKDPSVEEVVQKIPVLLCRNHSDEHLKVELAAQHHQRLLTTTQQSAAVSREVVKLENLLRWAEKVHGRSHKDIAEARGAKDQANSAIKLMNGLYSPRVEAEQVDAVQMEVRSLLDFVMAKLFKEHVQDSSLRMVLQSLLACPALLSEEMLQRFVVKDMDKDFLETVVYKMTSEIIGQMSAVKLDVAANISQLTVKHTLDKLEHCNNKLIKLQKAAMASGETPEQKVSRDFTFRAPGEESVRTLEKRTPRLVSAVGGGEDTESDSSSPFSFLWKTRPKPARLQWVGVKKRGGTDTMRASILTEEETLEEQLKKTMMPKMPTAPLVPPRPTVKAIAYTICSPTRSRYVEQDLSGHHASQQDAPGKELPSQKLALVLTGEETTGEEESIDEQLVAHAGPILSMENVQEKQAEKFISTAKYSIVSDQPSFQPSEEPPVKGKSEIEEKAHSEVLQEKEKEIQALRMMLEDTQYSLAIVESKLVATGNEKEEKIAELEDTIAELQHEINTVRGRVVQLPMREYQHQRAYYGISGVPTAVPHSSHTPQQTHSAALGHAMENRLIFSSTTLVSRDAGGPHSSSSSARVEPHSLVTMRRPTSPQPPTTPTSPSRLPRMTSMYPTTTSRYIPVLPSRESSHHPVHQTTSGPMLHRGVSSSRYTPIYRPSWESSHSSGPMLHYGYSQRGPHRGPHVVSQGSSCDVSDSGYQSSQLPESPRYHSTFHRIPPTSPAYLPAVTTHAGTDSVTSDSLLMDIQTKQIVPVGYTKSPERMDNVQPEQSSVKPPLPEIEAGTVSTFDYLRGVDVIAETNFVLTKAAQSFEWEEYGFKLHAPKSCLPEGIDKCDVKVKVSLSGHFDLPDNSELVSAVYWIYSPHLFLEPLTVEIQHCAAITAPAQSAQLTFVRTKCTQKELPYSFKELDGGSFKPNTPYGSISVAHFSGIGVAKRSIKASSNRKRVVHGGPGTRSQSASKGSSNEGEVDVQVQYCGQLFIFKRLNDWRLHFVVTKDLKVCLKVVGEHYSTFTSEDLSLSIGFESDKICLVVPEDGAQLMDDWKIYPCYDPAVKKSDVDLFTSGKRIPKCEMILEWENESHPPKRMRHKVGLEGARDHKFFLLVVDPDEERSNEALKPSLHSKPGLPAQSSSIEHSYLQGEPELRHFQNLVACKIPRKWQEVGIQLGLEEGELKAFSESAGGDHARCFSSVFTAWKNRQTREFSWETVVNVLRSRALGEFRLADEVSSTLASPVIKVDLL